MSVDVMSMVFKRYPNGGGEMLLALALADHAHPDGTHIFPSIEFLAVKTRQSVRAVQYQLKKMRECGWLIRVSAGHGGRGQATEYQISPEWIAGETIEGLADHAENPASAKSAPFNEGPEKGANDDIKGANESAKGAKHDSKGCNGLHPHITVNKPSETSKKRKGGADAPSVPPKPRKEKAPKPTPPKAGGTVGVDELVAEGVDPQVALDWLKVRKVKDCPLTATAWDGVKAEAEKAGLKLGEAVRIAAQNSWAGFKATWHEKQKAEAGGAKPAADDLDWLKSWPGIVAKGNALGLRQDAGEQPPDFKMRVLRAAGLTEEQKARARADFGVNL